MLRLSVQKKALPFGIRAFSYTTFKSTNVQPQQNSSEKFNVMSFINRIDALYDIQNKKEPVQVKDKGFLEPIKPKKIEEKPKWNNRREGQTSERTQRSRPSNRPNQQQRQPRQAGQNQHNQSGESRQHVPRHNNQPRHNQQNRPQRDDNITSRLSNSSQEKLDLHITPSSKDVLSRSSTLKRAWGAAPHNQPQKTFRQVKPQQRHTNYSSSKPNSKRNNIQRKSRSGSGSRDRKRKASTPTTTANKEIFSGITAQNGLQIIDNLISYGKPSSTFVEVNNIGSPDHIVRNLAPSAVTYDTRIWSAINSLRLHPKQRQLLRSNRDLVSQLVHQTVNGTFKEYTITPSSNNLGSTSLANTVNSNSTLSPSAKKLISQVASGKIPLSTLKLSA